MVKIRLSLMMFAQYFAWGVWMVPLGTYLSKGLNFGSIIGATFGLIGIATIASTLIIGMVADRFLSAQKVMGLLCLGAGASLLWLSTITESPSLFLFACLLHFLFFASTIPLGTTIAFGAMDDIEREFPVVRMWGTVGFIVAGLMIGSITGAAETALPMRIAGIVCLLLGLYAFTLPETPPRARGERINMAALLGLDILARYRDRPFWIFILTIFVLMFPTSFYHGYANPFLTEKNLVVSVFGYRLEATAIQTFGQMSEMLFLISLPFLLRRMGIKPVLVLGMIAWGIRFIAFGNGFVGTQAIVPVMLFGVVIHGICSDFLFISGQIYVNSKFKPSERARAQAFFTFVTQGIGAAVGANLAGAIYAAHTISPNEHDWSAIWAVPAVVGFVAALIFAITFRDNRVVLQVNEVGDSRADPVPL